MADEKPKYPIKHSVTDLIKEKERMAEEFKKAKEEEKEKNSFKKMFEGIDELKDKKHSPDFIKNSVNAYLEEDEEDE